MEINKSLKKWLIILIVIQFIAITFVSLHNQLYSWDEAAYILNGMDLAHKDMSPILNQYIAHERHPLLSWINAFIFSLNLPFFFLNLLSPLSLFFFFLLIYKMGKHLFNEQVGLISGLITITIPVAINTSTKILTDIHGTLLFSLCLYLYYLGLENKKYFLLGGLIAGISILMRDMNILLLPILIIFFGIFYKKINLKYFFSSALLAFLALLPYFIDNYLRWGHPLYRILAHIEMVKLGIGYGGFILQNISYAWILFLPLYLGIPIFCFFLLSLYRNKKNILQDDKLKFLLLIFIVPFLIFIFNQKIDGRLSLIFVIPVLLLGTKELLSLNKKKFLYSIILILIVNGFLITNLIAYNRIHLAPEQKDCFDFIQNHIPLQESIYSNYNPPSVVAWYSNRSTTYSLTPENVSTLNYYFRDQGKFTPVSNINNTKYDILFNNSRCVIYKKHNSTI